MVTISFELQSSIDSCLYLVARYFVRDHTFQTSRRQPPFLLETGELPKKNGPKNLILSIPFFQAFTPSSQAAPNSYTCSVVLFTASVRHHFTRVCFPQFERLVSLNLEWDAAAFL